MTIVIDEQEFFAEAFELPPAEPEPKRPAIRGDTRKALVRLIRENLGKSKRYLNQSQGVAKQMILAAIDDMETLDSITVDRLAVNLRVGINCLLVDPDVVHWYLDAACFELLSVK